MAEVRFARSLYTDAAVRAAAEAYAGVCSISVAAQGDELIATFSEEVDQPFVDAFANHALFETIVGRSRNDH